MKKYLNRDVFLILLGNMLADYSFIGLLFLVLIMFFLMNNNNLGFAFVFLFLLFFLVRLIILPIVYTYLEKNTKHNFIKIFIYKLRTSWFVKFLILLLTLIPTIIDLFCLEGYFFFDTHLFRSALFLGLFGSYLILFLYWFIVDIIKHIKEQR